MLFPRCCKVLPSDPPQAAEEIKWRGNQRIDLTIKILAVLVQVANTIENSNAVSTL